MCPIAQTHLPSEVEARHEHRLEAVRYSAVFGVARTGTEPNLAVPRATSSTVMGVRPGTREIVPAPDARRPGRPSPRVA